MKKIEAIIRKTKFEDVKDALLEADIEWFSYYDVRGIGKARQDVSTVVWCMIPVRLKESWFPSWCAKRMWRKQCKPSSRRRTPAR